MATVRTIDFLPEIFQTPANKQFLAATLDQLVQEPQFIKSQGYVGRRVGPGITSLDQYVVEDTVDRNNYQLEPGVVMMDPTDTTKVKDAITYLGMNDAVTVQGGYANDPDRLYKSEFYSWDSFVDYDKLVNYNEYYWLKDGPPSVPVYATKIPTAGTINVTRKDGAYQFSGIMGTNPETSFSVVGNNPTLRLARGGNYKFNVDQQYSSITEILVGNVDNNAWYINYENNPSFTFVRGHTYIFNMNVDNKYNLYIKDKATLGTTHIYKEGVFNNGGSTGIVKFTVPQTAPDTLYYVCDTEVNMRGVINIIDEGNTDGPRFCIQAQKGISGVLDYSPNQSSREVLGVSNNGIDVGTLTFTVPQKLAQAYYYDMADGGYIDLVSVDVPFSEIDGVPVATYLVNHPNGIDEITNLDQMRIIWADGSSPLPTIYKATYVMVGGVQTISLDPWNPPADLTKYFVNFGTKWSQTTWYKNVSWHKQPLMTAAMDTIYYQDSLDPNIYGVIEFIDVDTNFDIELKDVLGQEKYTAPNGVVFTNGLKVTFAGPTKPTSYEGKTYVVDGVGTAITLTDWSTLVTPEPYNMTKTEAGIVYEPSQPNYITIKRDDPNKNSWARNNRWFHKEVVNASYAYTKQTPVLAETTKARRPILEFRSGLRLANYGGKDFAGAIAVIDFDKTHAFRKVNGANKLYAIDGYDLADGDIVIFNDDKDADVTNNLYKIKRIDPDSIRYEELDPWDGKAWDEPLWDEVITPAFAQAIYQLELYYTPKADDTVICQQGNTQRGLTYRFDGKTWVEAQSKTSANDYPFFDLFDKNGVSFTDQSVYYGSSFQGCRLFGFKDNPNGSPDNVLGFPLSYYSVATVGDIVFQNYFYTDTFTYQVNSSSVIGNAGDGFVHEYNADGTYVRKIGWETAVTSTLCRQRYEITYVNEAIKLDVAVRPDNIVPSIQMYISGKFIPPTEYSWQTDDRSTTIVLTPTGFDDGCCSKKPVYQAGDLIQIDVLSDQISPTAFFVVPSNLSNNPLNDNSAELTLGTVRRHYSSICENLLELIGPVNGPNNTRDLGNIVPYGTQIVQQAGPLTMPGYFMRSTEHNVFGALNYNSREYTKFKSKLLDYALTHDVTNMTGRDILDQAITEIMVGRTTADPFYWSDMLPWGSNYTSIEYTYDFLSGKIFSLSRTYDFTTQNYNGLVIYLTQKVNGITTTRMLYRHYDYVVSTDTPQIEMLCDLTDGDVISIREYADTFGSYVPNTPTAMGLYPASKPEIYTDDTYLEPRDVIRGHDGSLTMVFGDVRDEVLLEFEQRIYNNIKCDGNPIPLIAADVVPGFFRKSLYTNSEILSTLADDYLSWVGWNRLDYKTQQFIQGNQWTYNYSTSGSKLNTEFKVDNVKETPLPGAWRGMFRYFYDTIDPSLRPWEMLGFSEMPSWWEGRYSTVPYTNSNFVLWEDLQAGYIAEPGNERYDARYARPGLMNILPVTSEGDRLGPLDSIVGQNNPIDFKKSWVVGDGGPTEYAWWTSSAYPFAVMRLLAVTQPAKFFAYFADRDLYRYNDEFKQFLYDGRHRLDANGVEVYGTGKAKASYLNWIVDYNKQNGIDSSATIQTDLQNLDVRLCYRMAGFTDKLYSTVVITSSSSTSANRGQVLPAESYKLLLYKNVPFATATYSSLVVEVRDNGYAIYGYDMIKPYFEILESMSAGMLKTITAGGYTVEVPAQYTDRVVQIPYGYIFGNMDSVVDFILSYGKRLAQEGILFSDVQNNTVMDWDQMAAEFLYFAGQGWVTGTIINLNPNAVSFTANRSMSVVDTIATTNPENMVLDQNRQPFPLRDMIIERDGNKFMMTSATNYAISFAKLKYISYEHIMVLDNVSIFNDLIYDPITGTRQSRIHLTTYISANWDGSANAPGFVYNYNNVKQWTSNTKYTKGEIVIYKKKYWQALAMIPEKGTFDYSDWVPSNYTRVQQGLLANIPNKADELANSYDVHMGALDPDMNLLAFGLIGFRPREYLSALDLSDVSQVNLYQQYIPQKGTSQAAELFTNSNIGRESSAYDIHENWGVMIGNYGGVSDRGYVGIRLDEANFNSNPTTIQIIDSWTTSSADQTVHFERLWTQSQSFNSPNIFPTIDERNVLKALPSAGYADEDDVDIKVFSLADPTAIANKLDQILVGTTVWAAKSNSYDWNVYRCEAVEPMIVQLSDNLNSTAVVTFDNHHNLLVDDLIVIKQVSSQVDGVYRVLGVYNTDQIVIAYAFSSSSQTVVAAQGQALLLRSCRVHQPADAAKLPLRNYMQEGTRFWADYNQDGMWTVYEKFASPYSQVQRLVPDIRAPAGTGFGFSVSQSGGYNLALVGAPAINRVYVFGTNEPTVPEYLMHNAITSPGVGVLGFGHSVSSSKYIYAAVGAPKSYSNQGLTVILKAEHEASTYRPWQFIDAQEPGGSFGYTVDMSWDSNWLTVGSPDKFRADLYGAMIVDDEQIAHFGDGSTSSFPYDSEVMVNGSYSRQLVVTIDHDEIYYPDFTISGGMVFFAKPPHAGAVIAISRRTTDDLGFWAYKASPTGGTGTGASFRVDWRGGIYMTHVIDGGKGYNINNTLTITGSSLGGTTPANNLVITVKAVDNKGAITDFTAVGGGALLMSSYNLKQRLYTVNDIDSFSVVVDGMFYRPGIDYSYNSGTGVLTFIRIPNQGAEILVNAGTYWKFARKLTAPADNTLDMFSYGIASTTDARQIVIGCPGDTSVGGDWINNGAMSKNGSGKAYVYDRQVYRHIVTDPAIKIYPFAGGLTPSGEPWDLPLWDFGNLMNKSGSWDFGSTGGAGSRRVRVPGFDLDLWDSADINEDWASWDWSDVKRDIIVHVFVNGVQVSDSRWNKHGKYMPFNTNFVYFTNIDFKVGDNIEISTSLIEVVDDLELPYAYDTAGFGYDIDICEDNDEVYVGAPMDGKQQLQSGSVTRFVNTARRYGSITSTFGNPKLYEGDSIRINDIEVTLGSDTSITGLIDTINNWPVANAVAAEVPNLVYRATDSITYSTGNIYRDLEGFNVRVTVDGIEKTLGTDYTFDHDAHTITFLAIPPRGAEVIIHSGRITVSCINKQGGYQPYAVGNTLLTVLPGVGPLFDDLGFDLFSTAQVIYPPYSSEFGWFGASVSIDSSTKNLCIGASQADTYEATKFDSNTTTFDSDAMTFADKVWRGGSAYIYDYLPAYEETIDNPGMFIYAAEVWDPSIQTYDKFGYSLSYVDGRLLVGGYGSDVQIENGGMVAVFDNQRDVATWRPIRVEVPQVDVSKVVSVYTYDRIYTSYQNFYDYINPLQGKVLGIAQQDIDYVGAVDPAKYNTGPIHNVGASWGAEHVGEIWWDTDNVRFVQPSQNDLIYTSRRWGSMFPGSTVDVYQWIASTVAPQQYAGQGSPLSTQTYTVITGYNENHILTTTYYYWVRGLTTVANKRGKSLSVTAIASYIADPRSSGVPYVGLVDSSTIAIFNPESVSATDTILHVEYKNTGEAPNLHEEFQLIQTESETSFLNDTTFTKLCDSLAGLDVKGARVPDAMLSEGMQYGVNFRPRQSMFINRLEALKNYLGYTNTVLREYPIVEMKIFPLLFSGQDSPPPVEDDGTVNWNKAVANLAELSYINLDPLPEGYRILVNHDEDHNGWWAIYIVKRPPGPFETWEGWDSTDFDNAEDFADTGSWDYSYFPMEDKPWLELIQVQTYDVTRFWDYADWYDPTYDRSSKIMTTIDDRADLPKVTEAVAPVGTTVKVKDNNHGKWELYVRQTDGTWRRVAVQDGTLQFTSALWDYETARYGMDNEVMDLLRFDDDPSIDTRIIIQSINTELFIDDMAIYRNRLLNVAFEFIYSEFDTPNWLSKTSLIDVQHTIRSLETYPTYQPDNQTFILDYIEEVKPYHCVIKDFNMQYNGYDNSDWTMTDFDNPAYWDESQTIPQYVSPVLLPYQHADTTIQNHLSDVKWDNQVWLNKPWKYWYQNYTMGIYSVTLISGGEKFESKPKVTVVSTNGPVIRDAILDPIVDANGVITRIDVIDPGQGYTTTPVIQFTSANGGGYARAYPVLGTNINPTYDNTKNDDYWYLPRNTTVTVKFDRYQYTSDIEPWAANVSYLNGEMVRFKDIVWSATGNVVVGTTFDPDYWARVPSDALSGVDRTKGFYVPGLNQPGLNLPMLIDGIDFPGVNVVGGEYTGEYLVDANFGGIITQTFDKSQAANVRWSSQLFDTDTIYTSSYRDIFLGTRPTDVNVQGGSFVDPYHSHAPEELVPGQVFDTLDIMVYNEPGQAYPGHDWAAPMAGLTKPWKGSPLSWADRITYPSALVVSNQRTGKVLTEGSDYLVDWIGETVTMIGGSAAIDDIIHIALYSIGGGFQIMRADYTGLNLPNPLIIPPNMADIQEIAMFVNGEHFTSFGMVDAPPDPLDNDPGDRLKTQINFGVPIAPGDRLVFAVIGPSYDDNLNVTNYSWNTAVPITFGSTGSATYPVWSVTSGTNPANFIVYVDGIRQRGPASTYFTGDNSTTVYALPDRLGFSQGAIAPGQVTVWLDDVIATQGVDYNVNAFVAGTTRTVTFTTAPAVGVEILISVSTGAAVSLSGGTLTFASAPAAGKTIKVVTWNDTRQLGASTAVIVGPQISTNEFHLGRKIEAPSRMIVSLNGKTLVFGYDFVVSNDLDTTEIELLFDVDYTDVLQVTMFSDEVVTAPDNWHLFQDMRGVQAVYLAPQSVITTLAADVLFEENDVIYVTDASALPIPSLVENQVWGTVMIDAERIMYRELDTVNNCIRGLLRGTGGTSRDAHVTANDEFGATQVVSMGRYNLALPWFQNYTDSYSGVSTGNRVFTAIDVRLIPPHEEPGYVQVFVGGERITTGYTVESYSPVTIKFDKDAVPADGTGITVLAEHANWWVNPTTR